MTEAAKPGRSAWLTWVLCALVLALLGYLVVVLAVGARAVPGTARAERTAQQLDDVRAAARAEMSAFLEVDYRDMDPLFAKVLDGATGTFKKQYAASQVDLRAAAQTARAKSSGTVRKVGISRLSGRSALLFVAADSVVTNRQTAKVKATKECPHAGAACRFYRFKIQMTRTADGWKMSSLDLVS